MPAHTTPPRRRERIVHKAHSHEAAAAWDREQQVRMTPVERQRAARVLKARVFPTDAPDVRACRTND
ncbi:MAG: hypothetical protein AAGI52_11590 [Bacteroidota bacterium]